MTFDIFLTACIQDADVPKARTIISGVTERRERHQFTRVQHYEPQDPTVKGFSTIKQLQKDRASGPGATPPPWQELHQILVKQPSFFHLRTDITEETQHAQTQNSPVVHVAAGRPSVVRWTDLPNPETAQFPFTTQRKVVDIADPKAEMILAENKFRFVTSTPPIHPQCPWRTVSYLRWPYIQNKIELDRGVVRMVAQWHRVSVNSLLHVGAEPGSRGAASDSKPIIT
jgi:hypothetical protein